MGVHSEAMAHDLLAQLRAAGVDARVSGGAHWEVDAGVDTARGVLVHSFWYERPSSDTAPCAAPRPSNERAVLCAAPRAHDGPEYLVILRAHGARVADGRTSSARDVVTCARGWLAGLDLDQLVCEAPFVDAGRRAMRAFGQQLDRQLRWEIGPEPEHALWVWSEDRRCEVARTGDASTCSFLIGPQQVAFHAAPTDLPAAVASWLVERVSLEALPARVPGVGLERHAEVLEGDPARWHWLHVLDRIADPGDLLAPLRRLIQALSESHIATRFYSYSSMRQFCFSASSHFVWVNSGLPVISPDEHGVFLVNDTPCDVERAVQTIEGILADYPIRPLFGSAAHHELPLLGDCLAREHSELRPHLVPRGRFTDLAVEDPSGQRRCTIEGTSVAFDPGAHRTSASWPTLEQAARAIRRYCEALEPAADIIADPATVTVMRNGKLIKRPTIRSA